MNTSTSAHLSSSSLARPLLNEFRLPSSVIEQLGTAVEQLPPHPFTNGVTPENVDRLLQNYLAMSLAFPYIQAGAHCRLLFHYMDRGADVPKDVEATTVVGSFLAWDETGGHHKMIEGGTEALPTILNTDAFHANLLKSDIETMLGKPAVPAYDQPTRKYLKRLYFDLSNIDPVTRTACMVAFEAHASAMIEALWGSVASLFSLRREALKYFDVHVGGDDPAEAYHVQMTQAMVQETVGMEDWERFVFEFTTNYQANLAWCESIKKL